MACAEPADDTESMPPPWRGKGSQVTGLDMELHSGRAVADVDESTVSRWRHCESPSL